MNADTCPARQGDATCSPWAGPKIGDVTAKPLVELPIAGWGVTSALAVVGPGPTGFPQGHPPSF